MPEIAFNGLFRVIAMRLVTPGNWYIGFRSQVSGRFPSRMKHPAGRVSVRCDLVPSTTESISALFPLNLQSKVMLRGPVDIVMVYRLGSRSAARA